jgi:multiple sugar transport system permease protein
MTGVNYLKQQKRLLLFGFLAIPLLLLIVFSFYPALKLIQLSFTQWNGYDPEIIYIGFENYLDVFTDDMVLVTLKNSLAYFVILLIQTALAIYLAVILDGKIRARNFFRTVLFMPYILNGVAVAFLFTYLYNYSDSPINMLIRTLGLGKGIQFLADNYCINFALAFISLWRFTGFNMVIFLSALQSIPTELYESASLDGANFFHHIRYITIPNIKRMIGLMLFIGFNGCLQVFFEPMVITRGGPGGLSETWVTKTISIAFMFQNFGKASAMGVILLVIVMLVLLIQRLVTRAGDING